MSERWSRCANKQQRLHNNRINIKYETTILSNRLMGFSYFSCFSLVCRVFSSALLFTCSCCCFFISFHSSSSLLFMLTWLFFPPFILCFCSFLVLRVPFFFLYFPLKRWNCLLDGQPRCEHCEL